MDQKKGKFKVPSYHRRTSSDESDIGYISEKTVFKTSYYDTDDSGNLSPASDPSVGFDLSPDENNNPLFNVVSWSIEDVRKWLESKHFNKYVLNFVMRRIDGDLLLQLTKEIQLKEIGLDTEIERKRFLRELKTLKLHTDYSSKDLTDLDGFLKSINPEYAVYTYAMLKAGVDMHTIKALNDGILQSECGISNRLHRDIILKRIDTLVPTIKVDNPSKTTDVFISYRRSTGSQLASLIYVLLKAQGFSVFFDVDILQSGKFGESIINHIRNSKNFLLILTPNALDRCKRDENCEDWVHKEISVAMKAGCNIIPIIDRFIWPDPCDLPEDIRDISDFNGITWVHDYQNACIDKLVRFMD